MKSVRSALILFSACLALGGCGDTEEPSRRDGAAKASGKILARSITDEMLPYDTVSSQPPRAKLKPTAGASAAEAESEAGAADDAETAETAGEPTAQAAPVVTPGAE